MAIVVETTARVQAERAQAEATDRVRLATENAEVGLWDVDRDGNISFFYARSAFSMPQNRKTPAEEFFTHVHPEDVGRLLAAYGAARDSGKRAALDIEYRTLAMGDIPARWMAVKGRGVFDADGTCLRMSGTAVDITKRKDAEQALRRSEEQLRLASEHADVGLCGTSSVVNQVLYWPARVNIMFGLAPDHPTTLKEFRARIHPDDRRRIVGATLDACDPSKKTAYDVEYRIVRANDGAVRWVTVRGRAVFDADDRCTRMLGVIIDTTSRKEIEERSPRNSTKRWKPGSANAPRRSSVASKRSSRRRRWKPSAIYTGGIAHDFNNFLQGVTGCLDLIRRNSQDAVRVHRWAEAGLEASEHGAKLTAQLLAFSRSQKLELKPVDLTELLLRTRDLLARTLGPAVHITINPEAAAAHVMGDETHCSSSRYSTLPSMRASAMPNGGELVIATHRHQVRHDGDLAPGDYIEITVADSGTGMPAEILTRAFDPFFTTKGGRQGHGAGLKPGVRHGATSRRHPARLDLERPGEGTTAQIFLRTTAIASPQPGARARRERGHASAEIGRYFDRGRRYRCSPLPRGFA